MSVPDTTPDGIWDESNPFSVLNLVPTSVRNAMRCVPVEIYEMPFGEVEKKVFKDCPKEVAEVIRQLRIAFWVEYDRAVRTKQNMIMSNVYKGLCSSSFFNNHIVGNSFRVAYLTTPLTDYRVMLEDSLLLAIKAEREILELPHISIKRTIKGDKVIETQYVDSNLAMVKHRIRESIQNRLQGMPVHRSMQIMKTQNISPTETIAGAFDISPQELAQKSTEELTQLIKQLREGDISSLVEAPKETDESREAIPVDAEFEE